MKKMTLTAAVLAAILAASVHATCGIARADETQPVSQNAPKTITVDFSEASLAEVLQIVAQQGNLSIIVAGDVKSAPLKVHLENVTPQRAVELIAANNGLRWQIVGGTYVIGAPDAAAINDSIPGLPNAAEKQRSLDIEFSNAPVRDVLSLMAEMSGGKIVVSDDVTQRLAFLHLDGEALESAFNKICLASGLIWQRDEDGIYYVETVPED